MTRKRARKLLMALKMPRNFANNILTIKPKGKTNAGAVLDLALIAAEMAYMEYKLRGVAALAHCCEPDRPFKVTDERPAF